MTPNFHYRPRPPSKLCSLLQDFLLHSSPLSTVSQWFLHIATLYQTRDLEEKDGWKRVSNGIGKLGQERRHTHGSDDGDESTTSLHLRCGTSENNITGAGGGAVGGSVVGRLGLDGDGSVSVCGDLSDGDTSADTSASASGDSDD